MADVCRFEGRLISLITNSILSISFFLLKTVNRNLTFWLNLNCEISSTARLFHSLQLSLSNFFFNRLHQRRQSTPPRLHSPRWKYLYPSPLSNDSAILRSPTGTFQHLHSALTASYTFPVISTPQCSLCQ